MKLIRPLTFVGYPCSGKGTQGRLFEKNTGIQHIDSGATLRRISEGNSIVQEAKNIVERGYKHPGKIDAGLRFEICQIILEFSGWTGEKVNVILDGWARDFIGLKCVQKLFGDVNLIHFIVSEETSLKRMEERSERLGDTIESYRKGRIQFFEKRTRPVIGYMRNKKRSLGVMTEGMTPDEIHTFLVRKLLSLGILSAE